MSRPLRIQYPGAFYHVMNRGLDHRTVFLRPGEDRRLFLKTLSQAISLWKFRVHAYSLMDNHYHLLIETPLANLSRAMRHIDGVFTQRVNRQNKRDGPLFRGRFKSILVHQETYFLELVRYIHLNGVRAVQYPRPVDDPHCSHAAYLSPKPAPPWLTTSLALSYFDSDPAKARSRLDEFVRAGVSKELDETLSKKRWPSILGTPEFLEDVVEKFNLGEPLHEEKPQEKELLETVRRDSQKILTEVAEHYEMNLSDLLEKNGKKTGDARQTAIYALRRLCRFSYVEIGEMMGGMRNSSVGYALEQRKVKKSKRFDALRKKWQLV